MCGRTSLHPAGRRGKAAPAAHQPQPQIVHSFARVRGLSCAARHPAAIGRGQTSFHSHPTDVVHFDIIFLLLDELRRWLGTLRLVKVKSHTGCLLNERADECAERGCSSETPEICPGPRKYGSVWLGVRPHVRASMAQHGKTLPRDSAPNHNLLKRTVRANTRRAVGMHSTTFVRRLLHQQEGATIAVNHDVDLRSTECG